MQFDFPRVEDEASKARIETAINAFVRAFYAKGGADPLLGPIFADLSPISIAISKSWRTSGRVPCRKRTATRAILFRSISTCRSSPRISSAGWNCSSRRRGKSCRKRRRTRRSPRPAIWPSVSNPACFRSRARMESRRERPRHEGGEPATTVTCRNPSGALSAPRQ